MVRTLPSIADSADSIPGQEAKIPHASQLKNQDIKQKQYSNKFNKDSKYLAPNPIADEQKGPWQMGTQADG